MFKSIEILTFTIALFFKVYYRDINYLLFLTTYFSCRQTHIYKLGVGTSKPYNNGSKEVVNFQLQKMEGLQSDKYALKKQSCNIKCGILIYLLSLNRHYTYTDNKLRNKIPKLNIYIGDNFTILYISISIFLK